MLARRHLPLLAVLCCLPLVACSVRAATAYGQSPTFKPPPATSPTVLGSPYGHLRVPSADANPTVSAELAVLDDGNLAPPGGMLVWLVTYDGACVEGHGPGPPDPSTPCPGGTQFHVVINATTGD